MVTRVVLFITVAGLAHAVADAGATTAPISPRSGVADQGTPPALTLPSGGTATVEVPTPDGAAGSAGNASTAVDTYLAAVTQPLQVMVDDAAPLEANCSADVTSAACAHVVATIGTDARSALATIQNVTVPAQMTETNGYIESGLRNYIAGCASYATYVNTGDTNASTSAFNAFDNGSNDFRIADSALASALDGGTTV